MKVALTYERVFRVAITLCLSERRFRLFKHKLVQFWQQIIVKMSIQYRDLNPRPFDHESSPITTRPGLPLNYY